MTASPTIRAVEAVPVRVDGAREFRISEGATRVHVSVVLRLLTDVDGLEGNAEVVSAPPGKPEEFLEEIVGAIERYVAPALIGMPVRERGRAVQAVARALKGRVWTKAAVTNALYDLHAKALGVPVADLLGGRLLRPGAGDRAGGRHHDARTRWRPRRRRSAARGLSRRSRSRSAKRSQPTSTASPRCARRSASRWRCASTPTTTTCPADAIRLIRAIERYRPEHVEQPVARHDILGLAEVRRNVGVPIMTDDMVATPEDAMNVIRLGAADRVKVKVTKHGFDGARSDLRDAGGGRADAGPRPRVRDGPGRHRRSAVRRLHAGTRDAVRDRLDGADGHGDRHRRQRSAAGARIHPRARRARASAPTSTGSALERHGRVARRPR